MLGRCAGWRGGKWAARNVGEVAAPAVEATEAALNDTRYSCAG